MGPRGANVRSLPKSGVCLKKEITPGKILRYHVKRIGMQSTAKTGRDQEDAVRNAADKRSEI